jgi:hypothetical protein
MPAAYASNLSCSTPSRRQAFEQAGQGLLIAGWSAQTPWCPKNRVQQKAYITIMAAIVEPYSVLQSSFAQCSILLDARLEFYSELWLNSTHRPALRQRILTQPPPQVELVAPLLEPAVAGPAALRRRNSNPPATRRGLPRAPGSVTAAAAAR